MKRAISEEAKKQRITDILFVAEKLLLSSDYKDITMAMIAKDAKLAKGTLFLYFETKEDLFLTLAEQLITQWSHTTQKTIQEAIAHNITYSVDQCAEVLVDSVNNKLFMKLVSILDDTLEQNISLSRAIRFKTFLKEELLAIGTCIEKILPLPSLGHGAMLLHDLFICLVGTYKIAHPSPVIKQAVQTPGLEFFDKDFIETLQRLSVYLITGHLASLNGDAQN